MNTQNEFYTIHALVVDAMHTLAHTYAQAFVCIVFITLCYIAHRYICNNTH